MLTDQIPQGPPELPDGMPETRIGRWLEPLARFLKIQSASGYLLLVCATVALLLANSPWSASFAEIWQIRVLLAIGDFEFNKPLLICINDGLMTIFFFVVGLEIKREFVMGELRNWRNSAFPIVAALGGMIVPAGIYMLLQSDERGMSGWGIPVATDIAFVAGFLAVLGSRVPSSLKITLMALAIVDDIGAILLIAFFYSSDIAMMPLAIAAAGLGVIYLFNRIGIRIVSIYVIVGAGVWLAFLRSGVHPTVAGVLLGFLTPSAPWVGTPEVPNTLTKVLERLVARSDSSRQEQRHRALTRLAATAHEGTSPLERLEFLLNPWVAFLIIPLFALANAGVRVEAVSLGSPTAFAITAGLVLGKPVGIILFSWIAISLGLARLPSKVNWRIMIGASCLAGIGFTMSIFIARLAMAGDLLDDAKIGILAGSLASAIFGFFLLLMFLPRTCDVHAGEGKDPAGGNGGPSASTSGGALSEDRWRDDGGQGSFDEAYSS